MFRNLKLRTKLIAIAVPALVVLAIVSAYAVLLSSQGSSSLEDLEGDIRTLGIVCMAAVLLSALTMVIIGRSIVDPVEGLKRSALDVANERLPLLVEVISNPGAAVPPFEPLTNDHDDELGELVDALNTIQDRVVEIAGAQQSVVRAGVSDLVVNLARRNQSLLDRQLELIDRLEHDEQDPERLEELFGLDHLATRMRRNAESLLVLAGSEPARRRYQLVEIADSIRVAMSEIENYQHVNLTDVEPTEISSALALDLAHLLSELMENATQFSPPERPVEVRGSRQADGSYVVAVIDRGIGMSTDGLHDANATLAAPPELTLGMSRSLGFVVVGHLARRLGAAVDLSQTPGGGTTATIVLTADRLASDTALPEPAPADADAPADPEPLPPAASTSAEAVQVPAPTPVPPIPPAPPAPPVSAAPPVAEPDASLIADPLAMFRDDNHAVNGYPDKLSEAVPDGVAFDVGVEGLLRPDPTSQTPSGLTKRDRSQSQAPVDEGRPAGPSQRSPEEIRTMLSRYRDGLKGRPLTDLSTEPAEQPENGTHI